MAPYWAPYWHPILFKPELDPDARRELLDRLLAPILDNTVPSGTKRVVLVSLFILLLVDAIDEVAEKD